MEDRRIDGRNNAASLVVHIEDVTHDVFRATQQPYFTQQKGGFKRGQANFRKFLENLEIRGLIRWSRRYPLLNAAGPKSRRRIFGLPLTNFRRTFRMVKKEEAIVQEERVYYTSKGRAMSITLTTTTVSTIGYQGVTLERFIRKLHEDEINLVIDVRANPFSHKPGFSKSKLSAALAIAGISYRHFPDLGIPSKYRKQYEEYRDLFKFYDTEILPNVTESVKKAVDLCENYNAVLLCFEENASECHRSHLSAFMAKNYGIKQIHLYF